MIGGAGGVLSRLSVRETDDSHHRDRRHPNIARCRIGRPLRSGISVLSLVRIFRIGGKCLRRVILCRKKRGAKLSTTQSIAAQFELSTEWRERRKISVAGTAGLSGLPREAW